MNVPGNQIRQLPSRLALFLLCSLSGTLILIVFWPVRTFDFVAYDDQQYVTNNPLIQGGLTYVNLTRAFTTFHAANWHPLTWLSHMLDVQFFGLNAGAHHLTSLSLHIGNSILLLLVLQKMTGALWRSALVASFFALHPMHVESVAWIAERKDVLSTFFFMLTLWAYARYVESKVQTPLSSLRSPHSTIYYLLALFFFALGLLSKPMLVTLPFVLLLLDYWPLERLQIKNLKSKIKDLLLEKLPFFLLAIASSLVTFLAQHSGGSVASLQLFSFSLRVANALAGYVGYLEKLVWPVRLAVLYLPENWSSAYLSVAVLLLAVITLLAVWQAQKRPYLIVGWLWFVGTLVPVIGLVQVGSQYMADRYSYVPFIGLFICVVWGGWELVKRGSEWNLHLSPQASPLRRGEGSTSATVVALKIPPRFLTKIIAWTVGLLAISAGALATRNQLEYWRTGETLFRHCIEVTTNNFIAYNNVGAILVNQGKYDEALPFYSESMRINPRFADTVMNIGTLLAIRGDGTNAVAYLQQAVKLAPKSAECHGKLALALAQQGRIQEAVSSYRESLRLKADQVTACNNLAWILATNPDAQVRNGAEAVLWAEHACELTQFQHPMLIGTLAAAYAEAGRPSEAVLMAEKAITLASASGETQLADRNRELKELYRAGKPYHEALKQW